MKGVEPAYANHVRRFYGGQENLGRLLAAGETVDNVTRQPGWSVVMDLIDAEREDIRQKLEGARPLDASETQHLLGQLRGLRAAEAAAQALSALSREAFEEQQRKHEMPAGESAVR